jgi:hypothetical protein
MLERGLTTIAAIRATFGSIESELYRFPAIDAAELRVTIERLTSEQL